MMAAVLYRGYTILARLDVVVSCVVDVTHTIMGTVDADDSVSGADCAVPRTAGIMAKDFMVVMRE